LSSSRSKRPLKLGISRALQISCATIHDHRLVVFSSHPFAGYTLYALYADFSDPSTQIQLVQLMCLAVGIAQALS
jgi:hypothetical protein